MLKRIQSLIEKRRAQQNLKKAEEWSKENGRPLGVYLRSDHFRDGKTFRIYELPATEDRSADLLFVPDD